jgi:hypothetical protein
MRKIMKIVMTSASLSAVAVAGAAETAQTTAGPKVQLVAGTAASLDERLPLARDGRALILKSQPALGSHALTFSLVLPMPKIIPENPVARVALAIHGPYPVELIGKVWLPKSNVWQPVFQNDYLPSKKGSVVIFVVPMPKRALAGEHIEFRVAAAHAKPFTVHLDAAVLQVASTKAKPNRHVAAAKKTGYNGPRYRIHRFAGKSSGNHGGAVSRISSSGINLK